MSKQRRMQNTLAMGLVFGCTFYLICRFLLDGYWPVIAGVFAGVLFSLGIYLALLWEDKKRLKLVSGIEHEIVFKDATFFYENNRLSDGMLFLTKEKLCFYESKKPQRRYEYPLREIDRVEYGAVFRRVMGCVVTLRNGYTAMFGMPEKEFVIWMGKIKDAIEGLSDNQFGSNL